MSSVAPTRVLGPGDPAPAFTLPAVNREGFDDEILEAARPLAGARTS